MDRIIKIGKAIDRRYIPILAFFIAFLMLGNILVYADMNENNQDSVGEKISYFEIGDEIVGITISMGKYNIFRSDDGDEITIENFGRLLIPGKPNLPSKIFSIAIPPGAIVKDVIFETGDAVLLAGEFDIRPNLNPGVIGEEDPIIAQEQQIIYENNYEEVYGNDDPYPSSVGEFIRTSSYRKYNLVDVRITPFNYYPLSGNLVFYPKITIKVKYSIPKDFSKDDIIIDNLKNTEKIAERIIVNYKQTSDWYSQQTQRSSYDYVIITLDSLTSYVSPLENWEISKGRNVNVVTTSWIDSNYAGYDLAEKIRNFLREKYPSGEWGIEAVCLIGDYDDVPMRLCWQDLGYGKPETDYYYAELSLPDSQSWDADGDHKYGENTDPIDFYNEIVVGRIPWSDPSTVQSICQKSANYEQNDDPSFKKNILLLGAFFWSDTDNAVLMEYKTDDTIHPWMSDWTMIKMYEMGQSTYPMDYNLEYNNVETVWSQGKFAFVNWAGHGSPDACYEYYPSQPFVDTDTCVQLNDDYPAIIFADACSNSDTDYLNIGKAMLKQGGVGFLGSTKVAYGMHAWNDPYDGSSQSLDYFFTSCVTSGDYTQGEAHQFGLIEMYTNGLWYYDRFETFEWGALWGNPDLGMAPIGGYNLPPNTPETPSGPTEGGVGVDYTFTTSTIDPESNQIYYMWNWGDEVSGWYGPYDSGGTIEVSHIWDTSGEYDIQVIAKDSNGAQSSWSDTLTITIESVPVIEIGTITGGFGVNVVIRNIGAVEATNIQWSIELDGLILIGQKITGSFEKIQPGFGPTASTGLVLGLGPVKITVTADDKQKTVNGLIIGPFAIL